MIFLTSISIGTFMLDVDAANVRRPPDGARRRSPAEPPQILHQAINSGIASPPNWDSCLYRPA